MKLSGANVLLTGGGRGLGRHILERMLADGAAVTVLERDPQLCEELQGALNELPVRILCCDVTDAGAIDSAFATVKAEGQFFDALVNNAGRIHSEPLVNMLKRDDRAHSEASWSETLRANLDSVFLVTRRFMDLAVAQRRKVVVVSISSIAAEGNAGQSAYAAAKAGVNALTRTWAKELGPLGHRFAAVAPGFIDTPSTRAALSPATIEYLEKRIPLRRLGEPEAIYLSVRHAIENDYLNGVVLDVDGGLRI
jgi:3-oxoacyl-[acyl-carrier protein] reductase